MKKILALPILAAAALASSSSLTAEQIGSPHLFELRTYHAAPGKLEALLKRFKDHTLALFEKHGMTNVGYWIPIAPANDGTVVPAEDLLIFLLSYPDREARETSWTAFGSDPEWTTARDASENEGKLVSRVDQLFLEPTDYSSPFVAADDGVTRLFELRTYTTVEGKLDNLHARFRDHTTKLFENHGMTNLGYFTLAEGQPGADRTLLYFLAHKDLDAARASFAAFREDPVWLAARRASEEAAGGSLTVPDGVKSQFLMATGFSPVR